MRPTGRIHNAKLETSPRLKRLYGLLSGGAEYTTLEIMKSAQICAVNSAVAELRSNGYTIICRQIDRGVFSYRMEVDDVRG